MFPPKQKDEMALMPFHLFAAWQMCAIRPVFGVFQPKQKDEMSLMPFHLFAWALSARRQGIIPMMVLAGVKNFHRITVLQIAREHAFGTEAVRGGCKDVRFADCEG